MRAPRKQGVNGTGKHGNGICIDDVEGRVACQTADVAHGAPGGSQCSQHALCPQHVPLYLAHLANGHPSARCTQQGAQRTIFRQQHRDLEALLLQRYEVQQRAVRPIEFGG